MLYFCTLFDSNYLSRGLTTYYSLENVCPDFHLYIVAFDTTSSEILERLNLKYATIISLSDFEDEELLKVKPTRSAGEYCWTATPSTINFVLKKYKIDHCTYLDADLFFYSNPQILVDEMGVKSVLITSHRYTPKYDKSKLSGEYCVQFMTFKNTLDGLVVLNWWRQACLDWCYARFEDGKFGDQKYLDDWTTRFPGIVHELANLGGGVAPWNIQQYDIHQEDTKLMGREKTTGKTFNFIFYHFHQLRFLDPNLIDLCRYNLGDKDRTLLYFPYIQKLIATTRELSSSFPGKDYNGSVSSKLTWKTPLVWFKRKIRGEYNIFAIEEIT